MAFVRRSREPFSLKDVSKMATALIINATKDTTLSAEFFPSGIRCQFRSGGLPLPWCTLSPSAPCHMSCPRDKKPRPVSPLPMHPTGQERRLGRDRKPAHKPAVRLTEKGGPPTARVK